ncbi:hypothetical protein DL89DRAFT_296057 [Linderina pennispora]|uniref:Uncharacterized protein n=1 Tax=Linderina pennispora TaxID=61395 RepID=A0A1Y1VWE6_9FUNG|nr:uncharacterized protein DL89DRAFT_296057 [Linderina pennispora]ORX65619.1 hypothetical protein DL89DRAFT_296057 [Linderina pennispora]
MSDIDDYVGLSAHRLRRGVMTTTGRGRRLGTFDHSPGVDDDDEDEEDDEQILEDCVTRFVVDDDDVEDKKKKKRRHASAETVNDRTTTATICWTKRDLALVAENTNTGPQYSTGASGSKALDDEDDLDA